MITYDAAVRTAKHWDRRGEYGRADAILLLIKANLPEPESMVLGAIEQAKGSIETPEVARLTAMNPMTTFSVCKRLARYGLVERVGPHGGVGRISRWQAVQFGPRSN